jgi:CIC family chloride channel protein
MLVAGRGSAFDAFHTSKGLMQTEPADETPRDSTPSSTEALSEIQEYLAVSEQRRRLFPRAALVGFGAGLVAAGFRATLAGADALRNGLIAWAAHHPAWGWLLPVTFSMTGAVLSVAIVRRYAPETSGSGIPHLKAVLHRLRTLNWLRVLPVKFLSGILAIGGGLALGREGPTVQMGGAVGDAVSSWLKSPSRERRTLIAAGAGAGLAAAFNAPLSGLIFVLEEIRRDFQPIVFGSAFIAAAVADIMSRLFSGVFPVFSIPSYPSPPLASLPVFALLGILAGWFGVLFNRGLLGTLNAFSRLQSRFALGVAAAVGAVVGVISWFSPSAVGGGHALTETVLAGNIALAAIPVWLLIRFLLTLSSYSTGASGGIFAPLLVIGALLGLGTGWIGHSVAPSVVPVPAVFAVAGMAAYFTAIVRAPLTGIALIVEMTGNYQQMLPLLISCFCAYVVAEWMKDLPIYEALLERDLIRDSTHTIFKEPTVIELAVEQEAPFVGKEVRMLGLPAGCVLVRCVEGGHEFVPTATTRLEAYMRITAVVAPEAAEAIALLRYGCKGKKREG